MVSELAHAFSGTRPAVYLENLPEDTHLSDVPYKVHPTSCSHAHNMFTKFEQERLSLALIEVSLRRDMALGF